MIGIVVVSHSRALGEAVVALAREMAATPPPLAVAAGLDETTFGTDATEVASAIEHVAADTDGVLVLVDIGSSVLSAELACELVDPELAERVTISPAPLVEGIVPAVVAAAGGADLAEVAAEAEEGLAAKQAHLADNDDGEDDDAPAPSSPADRPARFVDVVVDEPHGLHARPAAALVALVRSFDAQVTVANLDAGTAPVSGTSLSKLATLDAGRGTRLRVSAEGPQAREVLAAVEVLAARDFAPEAPAQAASTSPAAVRGTATGFSRGSGLDVAIGPAHVVRDEVNVEGYQSRSPGEELTRSDEAAARVADAIRRQEGDDPLASDVLGAHLALLDDDAIRAGVAGRIASGDPATTAWQEVLGGVATDFAALADDYQRERAQDVRAVLRQVLQTLVAGPNAPLPQSKAVPEGAIVVIDELDPATAAGLDAGAVAGVVTVRGGSTGHGVIVARSRGIPIFTGGGATAAGIADSDIVGFDAASRLLVVRPNADETSRLRALLESRQSEADEAQGQAHEPAVTADGVRVRVAANITSARDAIGAGTTGAEGSGLVRTEIVFGAESAAPSLGRQAAEFLAIASGLQWQQITIRTWDVGGDKPLAFLPGPDEANPMLGVRGLRLMRQVPDLFDDQLRAICGAAEQTPVRVMFPMVTTRDEVDWALERLAAVRAELGADPIPVGIMVEVPAAAIRIAELARGLDFVSIGTNDLTQYTLAADRGNDGVSQLADGLDPAVLQLIRHVADHVPDGVAVAVCGDLASRVEAVSLLLGLGVHELSAVGPVVPGVKQAVRHTSLAAARALAEQALAAPSAAAVRELLRPAR
ncbi:phosphoenolpyruvate--protein phosphotransferase [Flexivirga caeni]|uniref:Phosphocarrier protein HPr n=1 Tax=Flexivirga caeni TaxID=2294115 RepID=A0A3M9MKS0_9MICO|nr:phosphoenolpyruvate--protein phosphotransferase [Flexivirga caeni]RNI25268.1 phosphoenolpyruvate--protein phosphotransferase [Flexivirga caeni]